MNAQTKMARSGLHSRRAVILPSPQRNDLDMGTNSTQTLNNAMIGIALEGNRLPSIPALVNRYAEIYDQINAMPGTAEESPQEQALWNESYRIDEQLAAMPALTLQDLKAKIQWLKMPTNFNEGCFEEPSANGKVLLSLFNDIERTAYTQNQTITAEQDFHLREVISSVVNALLTVMDIMDGDSCSEPSGDEYDHNRSEDEWTS